MYGRVPYGRLPYGNFREVSAAPAAAPFAHRISTELPALAPPAAQTWTQTSSFFPVGPILMPQCVT